MNLNDITYIPMLCLKPAEMAAIEELPEKDKDLLLPLIPIKRWANSKTLNKSIGRIQKAIGLRSWIADIDNDFLSNIEAKQNKDDAIFQEIKELANPSDGYRNWIAYITENPELLPVVQLMDVQELDKQLDNLILIDRLITVRFQMSGKFAITQSNFNFAINVMIRKNFPSGLLIILDYGDLDRVNLIEYQRYSTLFNQLHRIFPSASFSISGTSFPYSFAGSYKGEIPIYERQIFNKVSNECSNITLIYSDRASTRALSMNGGVGVPPPRIDYPLKNDWRFIRKELKGSGKDKEDLYKEAAIDIMKSDYYGDLPPLWGTQMIEKTSLGDPYSITSASRATAVRINLHLYQQLHYLMDLSTADTEEDWID